MTDAELDRKYPNIAKFAEYINQQEDPQRFLQALLATACSINRPEKGRNQE